MKRFFIIICIMFPLSAIAQKNYQIKNTQGNVALCHVNEKTWVEAKTLTYVALDDIISFKENSSVTLLEKNTGRVFLSTEPGKVSVKKRLLNAEKSAQSLFAALNSELKKSVMNPNTTHPYVSMAAVTRSSGCDTCPVHTDLYDSVYTNIIDFLQERINVGSSDIIVEKTFDQQGTFAITIKNNSDKLLYFNVVHITDGHPAICYYFDDMDFIPLQSGDTVDLTSFPLILGHGQYTLIASEINLSVERLNKVFEGKPITSSGKLPNVKLIQL